MKAEKTELMVHISLPEQFINIVKETMEDELRVAIRKWGISLKRNEKDAIIKHSVNQLQRKVAESSRCTWDLSDTIRVKIVSNVSAELHLPMDDTSKLTKKLIKTKDGWKIEEDDEAKDDAVMLAEFDQHFIKLINTWSRTAVFYGVGSYT